MFSKLKEKLKSWTQNLVKKEIAEAEEKKEDSHIEPISHEVKEKEKELEKLQKDVETKKEILEKKKEKEDSKTIRVGRDLGGHLEEPPKKIIIKTEEPEETKSMFQKVKEKITFAKIKISDDEFQVYSDELEELLLENNVALEVTEKIIKKLKEKIVGKELLRKEIEFEIQDAFKEIIREILMDPINVPEQIKSKKEKPFIILFCGVNGTGKTTSIAKIAELLKKQGISSVLAAADTFRAASIEQLKHHGEKLNIHVIAHEYGHDPASVAFDAVLYAKKHKLDAVLIDTAGRMYTEKNLMKEIEKVAKVSKPDLKIFIGESITGNDAIEQAKTFNYSINIDGIILTKSDIDEKGGTALSVGYVTKKPILFLGTGQDYGSIEIFDKEKFIERLGL